MKRRGFLGSLLGGIVAAPAVAKSLESKPVIVEPPIPKADFKAKVIGHGDFDGACTCPSMLMVASMRNIEYMNRTWISND